MRDDYDVLWWDVREQGEWGAEAEDRYREDEHNGVFCTLGRVPNLDFVRGLPGLRYVEIIGRVTDDRAVFDVAGLQEAILLTRCKKPLPLELPPSLLRLAVDDRPAMEAVGSLPQLRELVVWLWKGTDLRFLGDQPRLTRLHLEGKKQLASLDGIQGAPGLTDLEVLSVRVADLEPLRGFTELRSVRLIGDYKIELENLLDLTALTGCTHLHRLVITCNGTIASFRPLLDLPNLENAWFGAVSVGDRDLTPLVDLPPSVDARAPDFPSDREMDLAPHSPTPKEVKLARERQRQR
jgi:hypothetical protein